MQTDFKIIDRNLDFRYEEIRKRIRRLQSRGTIDSLETIGANTENQVGASYVSLKQLAADYKPDEQLALLLWNTRKREEQIIACFLLPKKINKEKIIQLIRNCYNTELAEYFGSLYLCHQENLKNLATEWSDTGISFQQIAALTACARHLILYKSASVITADFLRSLSHKDYTDNYVKLVARRYY